MRVGKPTFSKIAIPFVVATVSVARDFVLQATRLSLQQLGVEIDLRAC